jgi:hypothetical protein
MKAAGWTTLTILGGLTVFEGLALYLGQFGFDFAQGGPEPLGLGLAWFCVACKVIGLVASRKTGLLLLAAGVLDWLVTVGVFQMRDLHVSLLVAVERSSLNAAFVVFALLYVFFQRRRSTA